MSLYYHAQYFSVQVSRDVGLSVGSDVGWFVCGNGEDVGFGVGLGVDGDIGICVGSDVGLGVGIGVGGKNA